MYEAWKDFLALCYEAVEKMEEKSAEYGDKTKQRVEGVKEQLKEKTARTREQMEERLGQIQTNRTERIQDLVKETGLASRDELAEVRDMLADLSKKVDELAQKKTGKKE